MIRFPLPPARAQSWAMDHNSYPDAFLRDILTNVRTIAVVGASPRPHRPSHGVMRYLQRHFYRAIPVNPFAAGDTILGEHCYAALDEIGEPVDMVDVFRRSEAAGAIVDQAIAVGAKVVWMRLGVALLVQGSISPTLRAIIGWDAGSSCSSGWRSRWRRARPSNRCATVPR